MHGPREAVRAEGLPRTNRYDEVFPRPVRLRAPSCGVSTGAEPPARRNSPILQRNTCEVGSIARAVCVRSAGPARCWHVVLTAGCHKFEARVQLKQGNVLYENESTRRPWPSSRRVSRSIPPPPSPGARSGSRRWRCTGRASRARRTSSTRTSAIDAFNKYLEDYPKDKEKVEEYLTTVLINDSRWDEALARLEKRGPGRAGQP